MDEVEVELEIAAPQVNYAEMVAVKGGTLPQGSAFEGQKVETFQIGKYEVTLEEWQKVRTWAVANGYDLSGVGWGWSPSSPVQMVNWYDVVKWSNAKSEMEGLIPFYNINGTTYKNGQNEPMVSLEANGYRLPNEIEWEWAARGGVSSQGYIYSGSNNVDAVAWYLTYTNSSGLSVVGAKAANELGIHDMSGNIWEWCWDTNALYHRIRGGSWDSSPGKCAVASRSYDYYDGSGYRSDRIGFRLARNEEKMVTVQGGTLPQTSWLAGQTVQTFQIGKYEVTWEEWKSVRTWAANNGYDIQNIGSGGGEKHPVQNITWQSVVKWCNAKSEMEGLVPVYYVNGAVCRSGTPKLSASPVLQISQSANGYRIPTMLEWSWAHQGGLLSQNHTYSGSNNLDLIAWTGSNSFNSPSTYLDGNGRGTWPVGSKQPNELGVYDMTGNVSEWCLNVSDYYFCLGGGCYWDQQLFGVLAAPSSNNAAGFRLARNQQLVLSVNAIGSSQSRLGDAFNYGLNTTGGVGPYTYQIVSGSLPQGLQLTSDGRITGTSQAAGAFTITMRVTDSLGNTKLIQVTITIDPASSNPSIALGAGIDSGGGLTSIGQLNNWSSIGSPMDTTSVTAGSARVTPGLLRMLLQLQTQ